jgi:hypothetical protein
VAICANTCPCSSSRCFKIPIPHIPLSTQQQIILFPGLPLSLWILEPWSPLICPSFRLWTNSYFTSTTPQIPVPLQVGPTGCTWSQEAAQLPLPQWKKKTRTPADLTTQTPENFHRYQVDYWGSYSVCHNSTQPAAPSQGKVSKTSLQSLEEVKSPTKCTEINIRQQETWQTKETSKHQVSTISQVLTPKEFRMF